jgi:uncharacterized membrane protein YcaP (DUF421 family)
VPDWLGGQGDELVEVVVKALLMYVVALAGLRVAHRRTLSQWTAIDFAAAVAIGAILGRTTIATGQSFLVGAVALLTILAAHTVVTFLRYRPLVAKATDHRVRVLLEHGQLRRRQMRLCGLTDNDLLSQLRRAGVQELSELRYVLYETKGELSLVWERDPAQPDPALVRRGLDDAAGYPR